MINKISPLVKTVFLCCTMLCAQRSFGQHRQTSYHTMEDTMGKPALIKENMISYGFFSPLNEHISVEYDRLVNDNIMVTGQVGIITSGMNQPNGTSSNTNNTSVSGGYGEIGAKLFLQQEYASYGRRGYYVLQGLYFKPQLTITAFTNTTTNNSSYYVYPPTTTTTQNAYTGVSLLISVGGQWVIAKCIVMDAYGGFGCCFTGVSNSNEPVIYNYYSYLSGGPSFPIAIAGGINIGVPF